MTMHTDIMAQLELEGAFAPVTTESIRLLSGPTIPGRKAIIDAKGSILGVVSSNYRVVQTQEVLDNFTKSVVNSGLDLEGLQVSHSVKGARSATSFIFPKHVVETKVGDSTQLRIVARNSHDGSWLLRADVGGFRIACANGQVHGDFLNAFKSRHTSGLDFANIDGGLHTSLDMFASIGQTWLKYRGVKISKEQAMKAILQYFHRELKEGEVLEELMTRKSQRSDLYETFNKYSDEMGSNVLALYNAMTDHATHRTKSIDGEFARGKIASDIAHAVYAELA
jgi:hypothetical protein